MFPFTRSTKKILARYGYKISKVESFIPSAINSTNANSSQINNAIGGFCVVDSDREFLYKLASKYFSSNGISPVSLELGVLRGANAQNILKELSPEIMFLVDIWSLESFASYRLNNSKRDWTQDIESFTKYFGGSPNDQKTFDRLFEEVQEKFRNKESVKIIRGDSFSGFDQIPKKFIGKFNYIYVDAGHQYEDVLNDLINSHKLLNRENGLLQLNDCCHSELGIRQNLGVLEAAWKFCRTYDYEPIVINNRDFSDVILAPIGGKASIGIYENIIKSSESFIRLPRYLFPNAKIVYGLNKFLSFE